MLRDPGFLARVTWLTRLLSSVTLLGTTTPPSSCRESRPERLHVHPFRPPALLTGFDSMRRDLDRSPGRDRPLPGPGAAGLTPCLQFSVFSRACPRDKYRF